MVIRLSGCLVVVLFCWFVVLVYGCIAVLLY